jgi:hypothetical protein
MLRLPYGSKIKELKLLVGSCTNRLFVAPTPEPIDKLVAAGEFRLEATRPPPILVLTDPVPHKTWLALF